MRHSLLEKQDSPAENVYSIICQVYEAELNPDEAFQQLLDILVETNPQLASPKQSGGTE